MPALRFVSASLLLASAQVAAVAWPADIEDYHQRGVMHKNACSPAEKARLKKLTTQLAGRKQPQDAWRLLQSMLCGRTAAGWNYVRANTAAEVSIEDNTDTKDGTSSVSVQPAAAVEPVKMNAWSASIERAGDDIAVGYYEGGVCSSGFFLRRTASKWQVVGTTRSCD